MSVGSIPRKMVQSDSWDYDGDAKVARYQQGDSQIGYALREDFLKWLDKPKPLEQRLLELEELDPRCYAAVVLKRHRKTREQIAAHLKVSAATAGRLLSTGHAFLMAPVRDRQDKAARLAILEIQDPQAHSIYCMRFGGYTNDQCADLLGIPLSNVKRGYLKAEKLVGTYEYRIMRKYARAVITGLKTRDSAEQDRTCMGQ